MGFLWDPRWDFCGNPDVGSRIGIPDGSRWERDKISGFPEIPRLFPSDIPLGFQLGYQRDPGGIGIILGFSEIPGCDPRLFLSGIYSTGIIYK